MTTSQPPTTEADEQSIHALFKADPEDLGDQDVDRIVDHFREKRKIFMVEETRKKAKGPTKKGTKEMPSQMSIDELLA